MTNIAKIASHSKWTLASSAIFLVVQAVQLIIVTHFVSKDSLGYLSISNAFVFLCISLLDSGVILSIIQAEKIKDSDIFQFVKFNLRFALILCVFLVGISYLLKLVYHQEEIQEIIFFMIPFVFISSFNAVFLAKMRRDLEFKQISLIEIFSIIISAFVVISTAMNGFEYLSIVIGYLVKVLVVVLLLFATSKTKLVVSPNSSLNSDHINFW